MNGTNLNPSRLMAHSTFLEAAPTQRHLFWILLQQEKKKCKKHAIEKNKILSIPSKVEEWDKITNGFFFKDSRLWKITWRSERRKYAPRTPMIIIPAGRSCLEPLCVKRKKFESNYRWGEVGMGEGGFVECCLPLKIIDVNGQTHLFKFIEVENCFWIICW